MCTLTGLCILYESACELEYEACSTSLRDSGIETDIRPKRWALRLGSFPLRIIRIWKGSRGPALEQGENRGLDLAWAKSKLVEVEGIGGRGIKPSFRSREGWVVPEYSCCCDNFQLPVHTLKIQSDTYKAAMTRFLTSYSL